MDRAGERSGPPGVTPRELSLPEPGAPLAPPSAIERALRRAVDTVGVVLLCAEVLLLLAGIACRYVFDAPLVWSDELASLIFVWLGMIGSLSALLRSSHMRLTTFVARTSQRSQRVLNALAIVIPAVVMVAALPAAVRYAIGEASITTPALGWPGAIRASALPTGFALMALVSVLQLRHQLRLVAIIAVVGAAFVAGFLALGQSAVHGMGDSAAVVVFIGLLFFLILAGIPIAFAFAGITVSYLALVADIPLEVVAGRMDEYMYM